MTGFDPRFHSEARKLVLVRDAELSIFFDVGANTGQFGQWLRQAGYKRLIHSFEPSEATFHKLNKVAASDNLWRTHQLALGPKPGFLDLHLAINPTSNSLRRPTASNIAAHSCVTAIGVESVPVARLDDFAQAEIGSLPGRFAIKIDTQGFEEEVLVGASGILDRVNLLVVEFSLDPMYEGQKVFHELLPWLRKIGFVPSIIEPCDLNYANYQILQVDVWFVRDAPTQ